MSGQVAGRGARFRGPIKVGLLTPYWAFFDDHFPPDYRPSQEAYTESLAADLASHGLEVTRSGLLDGEPAAALARQRFAESGVQVVVVAATMAAPPTFGASALADFDGPVVVWDDRRAARLASNVDEVEATRASSMLGSVMLTNVLSREGRRFLTVTTDGDAEPVARAVVGAAAAAAVRGARLGLLGGAVVGYGDVILEPAQAAALGIELVTVDSATVDAALERASGASLAPVPAGVRQLDGVAPLLERSLRTHRFLEAVADLARLDAVALNCHSDVLRWSEHLGVVACLGSSMLWSEGFPVACTGDGVTAVALMLGARIAGAAQYSEGYLVESATGELVVSSCGMADLSLADDAAPRLCPNELYPGRNGLGIATRFDFAAGPATIVAYGPGTPSMPHRLVVSGGELTGRGFEHLNGPSGTVRFDDPAAPGASAAWIDAAPAHHLALMRGDRRAELRAASRFLGVELIEIGPRGRVA